MSQTTDAPRVHPYRLLVICAILSVFYLALEQLLYEPVLVRPWVLVVAVLAGALGGWVWGTWEPEHRLTQTGRPRPGRFTAAYLIGLTGAALLLSRVLTYTTVPWVLLGTIGLGVGHAVHELTRRRRVRDLRADHTT